MNIENFRKVLAHIESGSAHWRQQESGNCFLAIANEMFGHRRQMLWPFREQPNPLELTTSQLAWLYHPYHTLEDFRKVAEIGGCPHEIS